MSFFKIFFKKVPKYTIVKSLGKFYIRRKCAFGDYEYLTADSKEEYWWSESYKKWAAFDTLEQAVNRWGTSDISEDGTDEIEKVVKILQ